MMDWKFETKIQKNVREEEEPVATVAHPSPRIISLQVLPAAEDGFIPPPLEGFLFKKGVIGIKTWKKRWFSLKDEKIYYYKNSSDTEGSYLGFIDLTENYELEEDEGISNSNQFRIKTAKRIWHLMAEAEEERKFWIDGLTTLKNLQQERFHRSTGAILDDGSVNVQDLLDYEEEIMEYQRLLDSAENEIEGKQQRINELTSDLNNSIQIIKSRGEQLELCQQRLAAKEKQIEELQSSNSRLLEELHSLKQLLANGSCGDDDDHTVAIT